MKKIPVKILDKIQSAIIEYDMIKGDVVYVALSGGKDSTFLCLALKELEYKVIGVTVDIGYRLNWDILKHNAAKLEIEHILLLPDGVKNSSPMLYEEVANCFNAVRLFAMNPTGTETICTPCYNAKMLIMRHWAESTGVQQIAFAHHGTDSITSLLKSYFYYYDYKHCGHLHFNYGEFQKVVELECIRLISSTDSLEWKDYVSNLYNLVREKVVGTDEPPRKHIGESRIEIIRPLINVFEGNIYDYYDGHDIAFEKCECEASKYRNLSIYTPREMIQYGLTNKLDEDRLNDLLNVVKSSLDQNGNMAYNVRNNRDRILKGYKDSKKTKIKL